MSEYGLQMREKQKTKRYYGILESQFRKYFDMANKMKGVTGENLLTILESRLDNVIYRLGFGTSERRQDSSCCGHFNVNGKRVDIPSYLVAPGDIVSIRDKSKKKSKEVLKLQTRS